MKINMEINLADLTSFLLSFVAIIISIIALAKDCRTSKRLYRPYLSVDKFYFNGKYKAYQSPDMQTNYEVIPNDLMQLVKESLQSLLLVRYEKEDYLVINLLPKKESQRKFMFIAIRLSAF